MSKASEIDIQGRIDRLTIVPELEMQMGSGGFGAGIPKKGYRRAGADLVSCFLQEFFIVPINGDDISGVLYLDAVSCFLVPFRGYHRAVEDGLDHSSGRCGYIYIWVKIRVITLRYDTFYWCEEMQAFNRKVPLLTGRNLKLFFFLDLLSHQ